MLSCDGVAGIELSTAAPFVSWNDYTKSCIAGCGIHKQCHGRMCKNPLLEIVFVALFSYTVYAGKVLFGPGITLASIHLTASTSARRHLGNRL